MSGYDATLIPGGGVKETGRPTPWYRRRLDLAIAEYQGESIITLSAGTTHKPPPLDERGFPIFEAVAGARYLLAQGIPGEKILTETSSYDTIGNAYFSRVIHAEPRQFTRLRIITSEFHLARTEAIFRWVYGLATANAPKYKLDFRGVTNEGMEAEALKYRQERERQSLAALSQLRKSLTTLASLHHWLFQEHEAYAVAKQPTQITHKALDTY